MKKLFLLPTLALGTLIACSDSSSSSTAPEVPETPEVSSSSEIPTQPIESSSSTIPDQPIVESSSSVSIVDPNETYDQKKYSYYGAELSGVDQFKYGRFEARMKMVSIPGSVSSMFLYYDDSYKKEDVPWNEIDIEVLGKSKTSWQSNIITREGLPEIKKNTSSEKIHQTEYDATEDFHLYAMIWTPEYVAWEIDSVEVRRDTLGITRGTHADSDQVAFLTETETLRFNLWASQSAGWVGKFTGAELAAGPQEQLIDYVRVYTYDEATKTFALDWQDDFEGTTLSEHWATGNWQMERVNLNPDNVIVRDGRCVLQLSREANPEAL